MKITTHLCKISDLGLAGNLFGGLLMYWVDEAAGVYAKWATNEDRVVTRRISEAVFNRPIKMGEIVELYCENPKKGNTSFSFTVNVIVGTEIRFSCECTFVAIDDQGHKKSIDWAKSQLGD